MNRQIEPELTTDELNDLYAALARLKTAREVKFFLRDLCTISELRALACRWQVANQLLKKIPYRMIAKNTGASTATITRVAHWLHHGSGGYLSMLNRISGKHAA